MASPQPQIIVIDRPTFDPDYACHIPGIARLTEALASLSAFICIVITHYGWFGVYISSTIAIIGFTTSFTIFLMHLFHTTELTSGTINWIKLELIYSMLWGIVSLIAIGFVGYGAFRWRSVTMPWGIASVCLLIAAICYFLSFRSKMKEKREDAELLHKLHQSDPENPTAAQPLMTNNNNESYTPPSLSPLEKTNLTESPRRIVTPLSLHPTAPPEDPPSYDSLEATSDFVIKKSSTPISKSSSANASINTANIHIRSKSTDTDKSQMPPSSTITAAGKIDKSKKEKSTKTPVVATPSAVKLPTKASKAASPRPVKKRRSANLDATNPNPSAKSQTASASPRNSTSKIAPVSSNKTAIDQRKSYERTSSTPNPDIVVKPLGSQLSVPQEKSIIPRSVSGTFAKSSPTSPGKDMPYHLQSGAGSAGAGSKNNLLDTTSLTSSQSNNLTTVASPLETAL